MATPIKTNELCVSIDREKFDREYDLFEVSTDDRYFDRGAGILDSCEKQKQILAIQFSRGNRFYILTQKYGLPAGELIDLLRETSHMDTIQTPEDHISITQISSDQVADSQLVQIMINALGNFLTPELCFCNLTGHLYYVCPGKMEKRKRGGKQVITELPCIDVRVDSNMRLQLQVKTFTNLTEVKRIRFTSKQPNQYPHYTLTDKNTLKRVFRLSQEDSGQDMGSGTFIQRTPADRKKSSYDFLRLENKKYDETKMYVLSQVMEQFRKRYAGIAEIHFREIQDYISIIPDTSKKVKRQNREHVESLLQAKPFILIDRVGNEDSSTLCESLVLHLEEQYRVKAKLRKRLNKYAYNLCLIHNREYYLNGEGKVQEDLHTTSDQYVIQHATIEDLIPADLKGELSSIVDVLATQLLIKDDIIHGSLSLYDWSASGFTEKVIFGALREGQYDQVRKRNTYYIDIMEIDPDGSMVFNTRPYEENNLFDRTSGPDYYRVLEANKERDKETIGFVQYSDGAIDIIKDPGWYTIPETEEIMEKLDQGDTSLRNKEARDRYLNSVTDIKGFSDHGKNCFFAGVIGYGMKEIVRHAVHIRTIESASGGETRLKDLLPLLNVQFVRNKQLTVLPFPFKYLREYGYMQKNAT